MLYFKILSTLFDAAWHVLRGSETILYWLREPFAVYISAPLFVYTWSLQLFINLSSCSSGVVYCTGAMPTRWLKMQAFCSAHKAGIVALPLWMFRQVPHWAAETCLRRTIPRVFVECVNTSTELLRTSLLRLYQIIKVFWISKPFEYSLTASVTIIIQ